MNDLCNVCYEQLPPEADKCGKCGACVIPVTAPLSDLLSTCPVCSARVSRMAPACPGCGHPIKPVTLYNSGLKIVSVSFTLNEAAHMMVRIVLVSIPIALLYAFILSLFNK